MQVSGFDGWSNPDFQKKLAAKRTEKWLRECSRDSEGNIATLQQLQQLQICSARKQAAWAKMLQTEDGKNCISAAAGDIDKTLACGASSVTFNVFLGAILATVLLVRAA